MIASELREVYQHRLEELVQLNKEFRSNLSNQEKACCPTVDFALAYATVSISIGTCTGNSHFIQKHAVRGDVILVGSNEQASLFLASTRFSGGADVLSMSDKNNFEQKFRNRSCPNYRNVYIDTPCSVFSRMSEQDVYKLLTDRNIKESGQTFIQLGR